MTRSPKYWLQWMFGAEAGPRNRLVPRWVFLRCMGLIYFSAFYALAFQIKGLIGPQGLLPAVNYLRYISQAGPLRWWYAPTLLWLGTSDHALMLLCWAGMTAALLLVANVCQRAMLVVCFVAYLSFVGAAQDFAGYQSDGMLLEAGFLSIWLALAGAWPGLGKRSLFSRASWLLLLYEWFRIYFESGAVKLLSHDQQWRHLTAMDQYYQNGPLPTWVGWYAEQMPHWFHWWTALLTLVMELGLVWLALCGRRARIVCFFIVTAWQAVVILTANYTFLNYLVLVLAFLLLDDRFFARFTPRRWRGELEDGSVTSGEIEQASSDQEETLREELLRIWVAVKLSVTAVMLTWVFYVTSALMVRMFWQSEPVSVAAVGVLEPFRIANQYGLFAVMTNNRYEVEFQGSDDGQTWTAYPFKYKPQNVMERPRIYAPYQPRFDWNLWFASLGTVDQYNFVPSAEVSLLLNDHDALGLFAGNPFAAKPPKYVRAVLWQYWFTSMAEKRHTGAWWKRSLRGTYAPTLTLENGKVEIVTMPEITRPLP